MKKIAIVGSRGFKDLERVRSIVRKFDQGTIVISGGADGVDTAAEDEARARGLIVAVLRPQYGKFSHLQAPLERNTPLVLLADYVLIFWDGVSHGTKDVIRKVEKYKIPHKIYEDKPLEQGGIEQ
jgi:hypothetical protein